LNGVTKADEPTVSVLRVFTDEDGLFGNPLGLVQDPRLLERQARQRLAAELAFSETVFIDDIETGRIQIFTPTTELPFAGHPVVGTAWFLRRSGWTGDVLRPPAGDIRTWDEGDITWIEADPAWAPQETVQELASAEEVNALSAADCSGSDLYAWAWTDEAKGAVRARYFAPGLGIDEDEATGSAAVLVGSLVGRDVTISQGEGSVLYVHATDRGRVAVGGRVRLERP
jgi:predicted PhzF superfamily epimerase YddE/YHI9